MLLQRTATWIHATTMVLLVATATSAAVSITVSWGMESCSPPLDSGIECGEAVVPRCHDGVCVSANDTIKLKLARYAPFAATAPVIWWVSSTLELNAMPPLATAQQANVYVLQTRDADAFNDDLSQYCFSSSLSESPTMIEANSDMATELAGCTTRLRQANLPIASLSLTSLALDVTTVLTAVATNATMVPSSTRVFVYARGRSTLVVRRLLQMPTAQTRMTGYIIDSLSPLLVKDEDDGAAHIGDALLAACTADHDACVRYFKGSDPRDVLRSIYQQIDSSENMTTCIPVVRDALANEYKRGTALSHALRSLVAKLVARNDSALVVPVLLFRIQQCDDTQALERFFDIAFRGNRKPTFEKAFVGMQELPPLADRLVDFSERWETPTPTVAALRTRVDAALTTNGSVLHQLAAYCLFAGDPSTACAATYAANATHNVSAPSLLYQPDAWATAPLVTNANVLLLASRMNGRSPASATHALYQSLTTSGSKLAVYSDAIQETELFSRNATISGRLHQVLSLFMARVAADTPTTGEWHVDDTVTLLQNPTVAVPTPVILDVVSPAFSTMDKDTAWAFFSTPYLFVRPKGDDKHSFFKSMTFYILVAVVGGVGLLLVTVRLLTRSRCCNEDDTVPTTTTTATTTTTDATTYEPFSGYAGYTERLAADREDENATPATTIAGASSSETWTVRRAEVDQQIQWQHDDDDRERRYQESRPTYVADPTPTYDRFGIPAYDQPAFDSYAAPSYDSYSSSIQPTWTPDPTPSYDSNWP